MLGWALIINNVGRRRYPLHWWAAGRTFVRVPQEDQSEPSALEAGRVDTESREKEEEGVMKRESVDDSELKEAMGPEPVPESSTDPGPAYLQDILHASEENVSKDG